MRAKILLAVVAVMLLPCLAGGQSVDASLAPLLTPAHAASIADPPPGIADDETVLRWGLLELNKETLGTLEAGVHPTVTVKLFHDVTCIIDIRRSASTDRGFRLSGNLQGSTFGTLVLVIRGEAVTGTVRTDSSTYYIRTAGDSRPLVTEIDPERPFIREALPLPAREPEQQQSSNDGGSDPASPDAGSGSDVTILVLHTPAASSAAGGQLELEDRIRTLVEETNLAFSNSDALIELELVGIHEVNFILDNAADDLSDLREDEDVQELRNQLSADVVHLLAEGTLPADNGPACGMGYVIDDPGSTTASSYAFSMSGMNPLCELSFAHEIGHNMGLSHDHYSMGKYRSRTRGAYPYSHGYVNSVMNVRSVMAYYDECADLRMAYCRRIGYFSFRGETAAGQTLGDPNKSDASRSLNATRALVANFR